MADEVPVANVGFVDDAIGIVQFFTEGTDLKGEDVDLGRKVLDSEFLSRHDMVLRRVLHTKELIHEVGNEVEVWLTSTKTFKLILMETNTKTVTLLSHVVDGLKIPE